MSAFDFGRELVAVRPEYIDLLSHFDCDGADQATCKNRRSGASRPGNYQEMEAATAANLKKYRSTSALFKEVNFKMGSCQGRKVEWEGIHLGVTNVQSSAPTDEGHVVTLSHGKNVKMAVYSDQEMVSEVILENRVWNSEQSKVAISLFSKFREDNEELTVLTIGSNMGLLGLLALSYGHRTFFFDGLPASRDLVCKSIDLNNFGDLATVSPVVLNDRLDHMFLNYSPLNLGAVTLNDFGSPEYAVSIDTLLLDLIYDSMMIRDSSKLFLHVSVGGWEMFIFMGAAETLLKHADKVIGILFQNNARNPPGEYVRAYWLRIMRDRGFEVVCCTNCQSVHHPNGRCMPVDLTDEQLENLPGEILLIRPEYLELVSFFDDTR